MRNVYRILVGNPERKILIPRFICIWQDNIKAGLKKIGCEDMDWIRLAHDRVQWLDFVNTIIKSGEFLD
jgi:hypothetical protein